MSGISSESIEASTARMQAARKAISGGSDCPWSVEPYASSGRRLAYLVDAQILAIAYLNRLAADREIGDRLPRCRFCGAIATCYGSYEGDTGFACDDCCGHGREDGHCESIADLCDAYLGRLAVEREEREERARSIDATWLRSQFAVDDEFPDVWIADGVQLSDGVVVCRGGQIAEVKTRGQLLDLLRILKGSES